MRGGALGTSLVTFRPLRIRRCEAWSVGLRDREGRWRLNDWRARVGGLWHRTAESIVLSAPLRKKTAAFWWQPVAIFRAFREGIELSCLNRELNSPTQSCWRGPGRGWIPVIPPPDPGGKASGVPILARGFPAAEVCHKPPHQIVAESGAVDHLDKEALRDIVERLRDVHRYGDCSAIGGLLWLKPENT